MSFHSKRSSRSSASTARSNNSSSTTNNKDASLEEMKRVFDETKVESGGTQKSLWTMTKETMGMADGGKTKTTDDLVETEDEGLTAIKMKIQQAKEQDDEKCPGKWDFQWTPLQEMGNGITIDDVFLAFLRWTRKDNPTDEFGNRLTESINVNKAFRRLDHYAQWMYDNRLNLEQPLTVESIEDAARAYGMKLTHDSLGRIIWWFDLPSMNIEALKDKTIPVSDSLRYFVWSTHIVMLDRSAQDNGMLFIQNMFDVNFWTLMTMFPGDLGVNLDRLTIGVMPVQMKGIYTLNAATWMELLMALMKPFMSKKMRQRVVTISKRDDAAKIVTEVVGGTQYIPSNCCGLDGTADKDIIFAKIVENSLQQLDRDEDEAFDSFD